MTKLLEKVIEAVRALPPERQDEMAAILLEIMDANREGGYVLSEEERAGIAVSKEQAARGEFASAEEVSAIFDKYR